MLRVRAGVNLDLGKLTGSPYMDHCFYHFLEDR